MTKIDIISGFLGAGKTTLIKKLLEEAYTGQKVVLIENEFGEIGIDGGFLREAGIQITEMNSGCICCSLVGDFSVALKEVIEKYTPDRIVIEPSGVGKLSDVVKAVERIKGEEEIEINSLVTIVDGIKSKMYMKNFGEFFNNQIIHAKTIILSRTQAMKEEKIDAVLELLRTYNSDATIITTPWELLDGETIAEAMEHKKDFVKELLHEEEICEECGCHHDHTHEHNHEHHHQEEHEHHHHEHHEDVCGCGQEHEHHHDADEVFQSFGVETAHKFSEAKLNAILEKLTDENDYGIILRAKGIVASDGGEWFHFDLVPGEYEVRKGHADYIGKICVIGSKLEQDKIKQLFEL